MSNTQTQPKTAPSPVHMLNETLGTDMQAVNTLIIERMQSEIPLIPQLASYLIAAGGKRVRPLLTLATTQLFSQEAGTMKNAHKLAAAVEFIHTATLLHDDVVDESEERRGQEAANLIFGNQASVLVGDFLFSKSFQLMVETESLRALDILSNASAVIAEGEVLQLAHMNNADTTMADYLRIIEAKTAALFAAACEVGPVIAGAPKEQQTALYNYGLNIGIAFQIADDILDYTADHAKLGKSIGDDFREGKITLPVILAMESASEEERLFWNRTIIDKDQKDGDLEHAIQLMQQHNITQKTLDYAESYCTKAREALNSISNSAIKNNLRDLTSYIVNRAS